MRIVRRVAALAMLVGLSLAGVAWSDVPGPSPVGLHTHFMCANAFIGRPQLQIVELFDEERDPAGVARQFAEKYKLTIRHVYYRAIRGFSAVIPDEALRAIQKDPRVKAIQVSRTLKTAQYARFVPALNPNYRPRFGARPIAPTAALPSRVIEPTALPAAEAQDDTPIGELAAAVLDTGIQANHPELNVDLRRSRSFVPDVDRPNDGRGHGTYIAGLIGAKGVRSDVRGAVPGASLWAIKVLEDDGTGTEADVIKGLDYVAQNARRIAVANMSMEGIHSDVLNAAVHRVVAEGVIVVAAAGNGRENASKVSPASESAALTVGSTDEGLDSPVPGSFATFSNFGQGVALVAPGLKVRSTWSGSGYRELTGTSVSAGIVSGALLRQVRALRGNWSRDMRGVALVKNELLRSTGQPVDGVACSSGTVVEGPDGNFYQRLAR